MEVKLCCVKTVFAKSRYERCKYKKTVTERKPMRLYKGRCK